jgi:hypothetical protein
MYLNNNINKNNYLYTVPSLATTEEKLDPAPTQIIPAGYIWCRDSLRVGNRRPCVVPFIPICGEARAGAGATTEAGETVDRDRHILQADAWNSNTTCSHKAQTTDLQNVPIPNCPKMPLPHAYTSAPTALPTTRLPSSAWSCARVRGTARHRVCCCPHTTCRTKRSAMYSRGRKSQVLIRCLSHKNNTPKNNEN